MKNNIKTIREKLRIYSSSIIDAALLDQILQKFAPNYTRSDLCDKGLITPLKRGKYYFNNLSKEIITPYAVWGIYMKWEMYAFWWLAVYNKYWLTTQVPEWYTIYNTKISGKKYIGNSKFIFKRQRESFFYWIESKKSNGIEYNILSPERAFIERIKEYDSIKNVPKNIDTKKLKEMAKTYTPKTVQSKIQDICI